jgi:hypothetical protein
MAFVPMRRYLDVAEGKRAPEDHFLGGDQWSLSVARLVLEALPYFLPAATAQGIMASVPPAAGLLSGLRLPYPRLLVFFDRDMEVPAELIGREEVLKRRRGPDRWADDERLNLPPSLRPGIMAILHRQPVAVTGIMLAAGPDGSLSDPIITIVRTPKSTIYGHSFVEGVLSRARLAPIARNLAAAVAWGTWRPPPDVLELPEVGSPEFRKAVNRGAFGRREPRGEAAGVQVLDVPKASASRRPAGHTENAHASPLTHLRRGPWRRQRIGAKDSWHYEGRWVRPTLVNPEGPTRPRQRVYRLPVPPAKDADATLEGRGRAPDASSTVGPGSGEP